MRPQESNLLKKERKARAAGESSRERQVAQPRPAVRPQQPASLRSLSPQVGKNRDLVGLKLEAGIERIQVGLFRLTLGRIL